MKLEVTFGAPVLRVTATPGNFQTSTGTPVARKYTDRPAYEGPYTITPTQQEQVFETFAKRMTDNITVEPIPSNYGLITWDGSVLTVS